MSDYLYEQSGTTKGALYFKSIPSGCIQHGLVKSMDGYKNAILDGLLNTSVGVVRKSIWPEHVDKNSKNEITSILTRYRLLYCIVLPNLFTS